MTKYWKASSKDQQVVVYATTTDTTIDGQNGPAQTSAHANLAMEAIGNYARARGLSMAGPAHEIGSTPPGLREVSWLCDFARPQNPVSIAATVYEDCAETD